MKQLSATAKRIIVSLVAWALGILAMVYIVFGEAGLRFVGIIGLLSVAILAVGYLAALTIAWCTGEIGK